MYCDFTNFFLFQKGINSGSIIPLANNSTRPASRVTSPLNVGRELENCAEKFYVPGERRMSNFDLSNMIGKIQDNITNNEMEQKEFVHEKFNYLEHKVQNVHEKLNNLEMELHEKFSRLENIENLLQKLIEEKLSIVKSTKENQSVVPENDSEV